MKEEIKMKEWIKRNWTILFVLAFCLLVVLGNIFLVMLPMLKNYGMMGD